jgi:hypothetical protein
MRPFMAIEREVGFEARFERRDVRVVFEVNVPVLNRLTVRPSTTLLKPS